MGGILTSIFYPQLLNLLKYWGLPLEDAMLKGGRCENYHKPEETEISCPADETHMEHHCKWYLFFLTLWLGVKTAFCNVIIFPANPIAVLKAFCRN